MTPGAFTLAYATAFAAFSASRGDRRVIAYLLVLAAGTAIASRFHLPARDQWALSACGALHLAGGLLPGHPVFYETWLVEHVVKYDQLVHFTVTATLTVAARHVTRSTPKAIAIALLCGVGNELFEAASSLRFTDAYIGGWSNATWDLIFNFFGACSAAAYMSDKAIRRVAQRRAAADSFTVGGGSQAEQLA
jgi:hypothetical protein